MRGQGGGLIGGNGNNNPQTGTSQADIDAAVEAAIANIEARQLESSKGQFNTAVTNFGEKAGLAGEQLLASGLGTGIDPRFEAFRQSQLGLLHTQQQQQQARQSEFFTRRGIAGSSAQLNQQQQLGTQFGQQQQAVSSQLGLQGLAQQNQNVEQGLEALAAQTETLSIPEQLSTARLAAANAGTTVSSPRQKFLGIF